jgi:hypothetical protein
VLVLALCAGVVLSEALSTSALLLLNAINVSVPGVPTGMLASALLIVIPSLILMIGGPRYGGRFTAMIGSAFYALFALILLLMPLQGVIALGETSGQIVNTALSYRNPFIALVILLALFDVLTIHAAKLGKRRKH